MNEMSKTLVFAGVAVLSLILAFATRPSSASLDVQELVGEKLPTFSPEDAKRLKIVEFDEDTATLRDFEVAENDIGLWTIPSKMGYPADAERQMAEAATSVMDREILAVVSNSAADHEQYGVIDPASPGLEAGQQGVGTRVTISDINDEDLIDLIIGKQVKDAEDQHYVRQEKQDAVYVTNVAPDKLSTNFEDWIEDDLLKLNPWDIRQVKINDYSAELVLVGFEAQIDWARRGEYTLRYDDENSKWVAEDLKTFDPDAQEFTDAPLAENEEIDTTKLNDLKTALDELRIVDVEKKPAGLSANLKGGKDFLKDNEAAQSLIRRGFTLVPLKPNELEILSSEGEAICTMKNGVEYVLRFGNVQMGAGESKSDEDTKGEAEDGEDVDDGVSRYLFAMVRMNEDAVERPELEKLPELPEGVAEESLADESDAEQAGEDTSEESAPGDDPAASEGDTEKVAADEAEAKSDDGAEETSDEAAEDAGSGRDEASRDKSESDSAESAGSDDTDAADADATEPAGDAAASQSDEESESGKDTGDAETSEDQQKDDELAKIIEDRKRIEKENQRKLDEYQQQLKEGREKVEELNLRFGDWYYVISNDVFSKIRLSHDDLVKEKEKSDDGESEDTAGANAAENASQFGAPGSTVPGLPELPVASEEPEAQTGEGEPEAQTDEGESESKAGEGESDTDSEAGEGESQSQAGNDETESQGSENNTDSQGEEKKAEPVAPESES